MKHLNQLRPHDLERVPVWRYEGSSDDDAVVHATDRTELTDDEAEVFIAHTQFALASGAQHTGFCTPGHDAGLDVTQPAILTLDGPVFFWFDRPPSDETLQAQWRRLGAGHESIFPVHFRCTVPVDGRYVTGIIESDDLTGAA
jgi:hypothetical protein